MSWPLASHFSAMLQSPELAFRDPRLQRCRVATDEHNQPRPWSGSFAVVYQAFSAEDGRPFAVRVFTTESPERRERYEEISGYLKTRQLGCLVDFEYRDDSIRSGGDGKWYPLIVMDWVEGETLFRWARARCLAGDGDALAAAARRWVELVEELADARIAHGDLQHANVMVTAAGELKLVDYDCMCVPSLIGRRNLEVGVEPYQHPDRDASTHLSLDLDHFSALMIYVSLRALALRPLLWAKYVDGPGYDKLLFRREDFERPEASLLFRDLASLGDPDVRDLAQRLIDLAAGPISEVPPLGHLANSYVKIEELLNAQQWDAAVELLNHRGQFRDAPEHLVPLIHQAYEHFCRRKAWNEFRRIRPEPSEVHDRKVVNAWNEALFGDFEPAEKERSRLRQSRRNVRLLDRLHHQVQKSPRATSLEEEKGILETAARLPQPYQYALAPRVDRARHCVESISGLENALLEDTDELAIDAAWEAVREAKCRRLVPRRHHARIKLARRRAAILGPLRRLADEPAADRVDRKLLELWNEELLDGCEEARRWQPRHQQAVERNELVGQLESALQAEEETRVVELLGRPLLAGYPLPGPWQSGLDAARDAVARTIDLERLLDCDDRAGFLDVFDARLIRKNQQRFSRHERRLADWTETEVLPAEQVGLRLAVGRASLVHVETDGYRCRWTWPQPRFTDQCVLGISCREPGACDDPDDLDLLDREVIARRAWETGGGSRVIECPVIGSYVVVWAVVDLGFREFFSQPLVLGRAGEGPAEPQRARRGFPFLSAPRGKLAPTASEEEGPAASAENEQS